MNDRQIERFEERIILAIAALDKDDALGRDAQDTVILDQQSVGRLSRMDALQQQAMAKATHSRRQMERQRLKAALERINEGEFGFCAGCGEEIAVKRLELDPAASTCVSCAGS